MANTNQPGSSIFLSSRYVRTPDRQSSNRRLHVTLEALEPRKLLSMVPLDGPWSGMHGGFEVIQDGSSELYAYTERFTGDIANDLLSGTLSYYSENGLVDEPVNADVTRDPAGRLDYFINDGGGGGGAGDFTGLAIGGVDPESMVAWHQSYGEELYNGTDLTNIYEMMFMTRNEGNVSAQDLQGEWVFDAIETMYNDMGEIADTQSISGNLVFTSDGSFTVTGIETSNGSQVDDGGFWALLDGGKLELEFEDGGYLSGTLGDIGSVISFSDIEPYDGDISNAIAVKKGVDTNPFDATGNYRIGRYVFDDTGMPADTVSSLMLSLYDDGYYEVYDLAEYDEFGKDNVDPIQTGDWNLSDSGALLTSNRSNEYFKVDGQFDETFTVLASVDNILTDDGVFGTHIGTFAGLPDDVFIALPGDAIPSVAMNPDAGFVITWTHLQTLDGNPDVYAQLYDNLGVAVADPFVVNTTLTGDQVDSKIAMDESGNFAITWISANKEIDQSDIYVRLYDSTGNALSSEILVSTRESSINFENSIAMNADGEFVISWSSVIPGSQNSADIFAKKYAADGTPVVNEFMIHESAVGEQLESVVAIDSTGNFAVAWTNFDDRKDQDGIVTARVFDSAGTALSTQFEVAPNSIYPQDLPTIGINDNNELFVLWAAYGADGDGFAVLGQSFGFDGSSSSDIVQINTTTFGDQDEPALAMNSAGEAIVAWVNREPQNDPNLKPVEKIHAQKMSADKLKVGDPIIADAAGAPESNNHNAATAMNADNDFVIAWMGVDDYAETTDVYFQLFVGGSNLITIDAGTDQSGDEGDVYNFSGEIIGAPINDLTVFWEFDDGFSENGLDVQHVFADDGNHQATFTVIDSSGNEYTDIVQVAVANVDPFVEPGDAVIADEGELIFFDAWAEDPGDDTLTLTWDFGDGSEPVAGVDLFNPTHTYWIPDDYVVTLTVTDEDGGETIDNIDVTVENLNPIINAGPDQVVTAGDVVTFNASAQDPGDDDLTFSWDFGDGTQLQGVNLNNPVHTYDVADDYIVTLTVTDAHGGESLDDLLVTVADQEVIIPDPPTGVTLDPNSDSGKYKDDGLTNNNQQLKFKITGVTAGATVNLYESENLVAQGVASSAAILLSDLADEGTSFDDGNYIYTATQTVDGIESGHSDVTLVILDSTAPEKPDVPFLEEDSDGDGRTSATNFTFNGYAEPLSSVELLRDGKRVGEATVADEGGWEIVVNNAPMGTYDYTVKVTDLAGNSSDESDALTITKVKPIADRPDKPVMLDENDQTDDDNLTNYYHPTFSGTADADNLVRLYSDGTLIGTAYAEADGSWVITANDKLADGNHTIQITQAYSDDSQNSESPLSYGLMITVDTEANAPNAPELKPGSTYDTGKSATDGITSNTRPVINGTGAEKLAEITLYDQHGNELGSTTANSSGVWSFTPDSDLDEGDYEITVVQTDLAGNESVNSNALILTIDKSTPLIADAPILDPNSDTGLSDDDGVTASRNLTFSGTAEAGVDVQMLYNGKKFGPVTTADSSGDWEIDVLNAPAGEAQWSIMQTDVAGNIQMDGATVTVEIITNKPPAPSALALADGNDTGTSENDRVTSINTPTITGTASNGAAITLYDTDGTTVIGTGEADSEGNWEITTDELTDGEHSIRADQTDLVGNSSSLGSPLKITIDTTADAPDSPLLKPGKNDDTGRSDTDGITSNARPTFTGEGAEKNATVTLYDQYDNEIGSTTASSSGKWSVSPDQNLTDGDYEITAIQTDIAGNESVASGPFTMIIDKSSPVAADAPILDPESDTGVSNEDNVTASQNLKFSGIAEAGAEILMLRAGRKFGQEVIADENGNWEITVEKAPPGVAQWSIMQTDAAGNIQENGETLTVEVITKQPAPPKSLTLAEGQDTGTSETDRVTNINTPTITGQASNGATITLYDTDGTTIIGTGTADTEGNWQITADELTDGEHSIRATQTDLVGNSSSMGSTLKITIDTTADAPDSPLLKPGKKDDTGRSDTDGITSNTQPTFTGEGAEKGATVILYDQYSNELGSTVASSSGKWSITPDQELTDGEYEYTVVQVDVAGNTSDESIPFTLTIDNTPPDATTAPDLAATSDTGVSDEDNVTGSRELVFTGSAEFGSEVQMMRDGKKFGPIVEVDENGDWEITITNAPSGAVDWSIMQTDAAGNIQENGDTLTVEVITKLPSAPKSLALADGEDSGTSDKDNVTNINTPTIVGQAGTGADITLYDTDGTTIIGTGTADSEGNWQIITDELDDGDHSIRATQTDLVGNSSSMGSTLKITIDTTADAPAEPALKPGKKDDTGRSDTDGITNNARPTFTGEGAEKGATVSLYDSAGDDTFIASTIAKSNGSWSIIPDGDIEAGIKEFYVIQTDIAGNESDASDLFTLTIDTVEPDTAPAPDLAAESDTGVSNEDNITGSRQLIFTGMAEAGADVQMMRNGKKFGPEATAYEDGSWIITIENAPSGITDWSVKQTDAAGNIQESGETLTVEVITKNPAAPKSLNLAVGEDTGASASDKITNINTPVVTGVAGAGNTVVLYDTDGQTEIGTAVADQDGQWEITTSQLTDDTHALRAKQIDLVGNESTLGSTLKLTVDTSAAALNAPTLKPGNKYDTGQSMTDGITKNNMPAFTGEGAEKNATITLYDQNDTQLGTAKAGGTGKWSIALSNELSDGDYEFTVTQTDLAGNVSVLSNALALTIDTTAPVAPAAPDLSLASDDGELNDDNITTLRNLIFTGQAEADAEVILYRDGKKFGTSVMADSSGAYTINALNVPLGVSLWSIQIIDVAGNVSELGSTLSVEVIAA